jgi:hypothetical protein
MIEIIEWILGVIFFGLLPMTLFAIILLICVDFFDD